MKAAPLPCSSCQHHHIRIHKITSVRTKHNHKGHLQDSTPHPINLLALMYFQQTPTQIIKIKSYRHHLKTLCYIKDINEKIMKSGTYFLEQLQCCLVSAPQCRLAFQPTESEMPTGKNTHSGHAKYLDYRARYKSTVNKKLDKV